MLGKGNIDLSVLYPSTIQIPAFLAGFFPYPSGPGLSGPDLGPDLWQAAWPLGCRATLFLLSVFSACNTGCKGHSYPCACCPAINKDINRYISTRFRPCCPLKVSLTICCLGLMLINDECTECELLWFNRQCLGPGTLKTPLQYTKYYCNFYIHQLSLQICLAQHNPFSTPFPISFALFN